MTGRTGTAAVLAALVLWSVPCLGAEGETLAGRTGKWTLSMNEPGPDMKKLGAARLKTVRGHLQTIVRQITALPVMSPPKGVEARFWGSANARDRYDICSGKACPPLRPNGVLALMIGSYGETDGKIKAAFNRPATMDIGINNLGHVFSPLPVLYRDKDGFLLPEPQRDGERQGMPAYMNNGHVVAVLTRGTAPLWVPVSRERYLRAAIDELGRELGLPAAADRKERLVQRGRAYEGNPLLLEEEKSWIDPVSQQQRVEKSRSLGTELKDSPEDMAEQMGRLQAELAALTSEQRQQQARVDTSSPAEGERAKLLPPDSSSGIGVVTPNFDFFNKKLPVDAVQLVTVQWKFDGEPVFDPEQSGISENLHNGMLREIYRGLDWRNLAEKLPLR